MSDHQEEFYGVTGRDIYPGYPVQRLVLPNLDDDAIPELIDGPWTMNNDPLPSVDEADGFISEGYEVDPLGRPLHPQLRDMLSNPEIGVVTGKGRYWNWGPNRTADPIVIVPGVHRQILLIQREDTGIWALPGGFIDDGEMPIESARRELKEETDITLDAPGRLLYQGPVDDARTTAHAWPETSAYVFLSEYAVPGKAGDDAKTLDWFDEDKLPLPLYGSHEALVRMALAEVPRASIRDVLSQSSDQLTVSTIEAGHMAYDHLHVSDGVNALFVKSHDPRYFDDDIREAHSRAYLQKEFDLYTHLSKEGFTYIPDRFDLIDSTVLALDMLSASEGWQWKAPHTQDFDAYVRDVLGMLETLQSIAPIESPAYHDVISKSYDTFIHEGWDSISHETIDVIGRRIVSLSLDWSITQKRLAQRLVASLPDLKTTYESMGQLELTSLAHHDSRQSNIAWHPENGAKLVDWSWADLGPANADATMILIDLAKSGHDVSSYMEYFNVEYAHILVGFWLSHSLWETRDGGDNIREHQVASAVVAFDLISKTE